MAQQTIQETFNLASQHHQSGRLREAEQLYREVLARQPEHAGALHNLGMISHRMGRNEIAVDLIRRAIAVNPNNAEAHNNLGNALNEKGQLDEAIAAYRQAIALEPNFSEAHNNLGIVRYKGNLDEAIASYRRAISIKPNFAEAHNNLGTGLQEKGQLDEAIAAYRRAIALKPDYAEGHSNLAKALLLRGDFKEGWREYEWRSKVQGFPSPQRGFSQPLWDGGELRGRTILLHAEQGLGDTIQFIRYLPLVARRGGKIIVQCQSELQRLFRSIGGDYPTVALGQPLPAFDLHCPLPSLPHALGTTLADIPKIVPYLDSEAELVEAWKQPLGESGGELKVGLAWAGNPRFESDGTRSLKLRQLAPLAGAGGVRFYSLQKGSAGEQAKNPPAGLELVDLGPQLNDFADTAAAMLLLDLIITTDTSVAHLAGALARPVWLMLQFVPDFRWLMEREDSPWYPTMRLFRQKSAGDWDSVIGPVADSLVSLVRTDNPRPKVTAQDVAQLNIRQTFDLALQHHQAGRLREAEPLYSQILEREPKNLGALRNLALIAHQSGRDEKAVDLLRRAVALSPNDAQIRSDLGIALKHAGQLDEAIAAYRQAIALKPQNADVHNNLGNALKQKGLIDEAIGAYRQAIALRPDFAGAYHNLGFALAEKGQMDESIVAYRQAIHFKPDYAEAHNNLGTALKKMERLDEAVAAFRRAIAINFKTPEAHNNLGNTLKHKGQLDEAIAAYRQAVALDPGNALIDSNLLSTLIFHPGYDAPAIAEENRRWTRLRAEPLRKFIQTHNNDPSPGRRLRIGYLSPDFRNHVVARNLMPLFDRHDRTQFEIICYSCVHTPDAMTSQFRQKADGWRDIVRLTDEQAAEQIREDRIDILVDLALHLADNRLLVFARKPAPVQVTFAGYPGSTGLETIDYRLTDPYLDPPGINDQFYSEKSYRLPHTFWCFDPLGIEMAVGPLPAQTDGHITFGCLNNFCKINEPILQLWAQVLKKVDRSRLLVLCPEGNHRQRLLDVMQREGVNPDRIELVTNRPRVQYLERYNRIDVGLDSFPYNGHSTSLDSLWMGVPVVTLVGKTVVGRAGFSQLTNLGLTELIAQTPEEFVRIAAALAGDLPRLAELRRTLRSRMESSPLMDAAGFTIDIEEAYRQMWRKWCAGPRD